MTDSLRSPSRGFRSRRWFVHLWREWTIESRHPIAPPFARPQPAAWDDARLTLAWLGHSTVLINFFGINVLTDPALFSRIGIRLPGFTIGPKRLTAPALEVLDLPRIDLVLLSHAHFDHFDMRTLHRFGPSTAVITASRTSDLLGWTRLRKITELRCGQATEIQRASASLKVRAIRVEALGRAAAP